MRILAQVVGRDAPRVQKNCTPGRDTPRSSVFVRRRRKPVEADWSECDLASNPRKRFLAASLTEEVRHLTGAERSTINLDIIKTAGEVIPCSKSNEQ